MVSSGSEPGAAGVAALGKVLAVASYLTDPLQPAAVDWSVNYFSKRVFRNLFHSSEIKSTRKGIFRMELTVLETGFILLKSNLQVKLVLRVKRTSSGLLRGTGLKVQGRRWRAGPAPQTLYPSANPNYWNYKVRVPLEGSE